jgi:rubrerythrin
MGTTINSDTAALLAELNDLLQLDHDAVKAYTLAEAALKSETHKEWIRVFKRDHERHIQELTRLVALHGGTPAQAPHVTSSPFKLAAQGLGDLGSDTSVLLAFKANERLSRDKYQRASAAGYPADVHAVLVRGADDESTHYDWVETTLKELGAGEDTAIGKVERVVEVGHTKFADVMEGAEKRVGNGAEAVRRQLSDALGGLSGKMGDVKGRLGTGGVRNVLIALGVGVVAAQLVRRAGSRRPHSAAGLAMRGSTTSPGEPRSFGRGQTESRDWGEPAL